MPRILHILAQRPGRTGSGVTLDALVRQTSLLGGLDPEASDWDQHVVVGVPASDTDVQVGGLDAGRIHTVRFGDGGDLPFDVPGMSDVMPYPSTVYSSMESTAIADYRRVWTERLQALGAELQPDLIHVHHIWILAALVKDAIPGVPVVGHCHATGLRQMRLVPALADPVREGNRRNDRFAVLHGEHQDALAATLDVDASRIGIVGAGYRDELFGNADCGEHSPHRLAYAGKLSASKGLNEFLDAFELVAKARPKLELHVAGGGSGAEADAIRARMQSMAPRVTYHGFVDDAQLVEMLCSAAVFVLPSYYEGLPLVLVEAAAAGCRLVATSLPGVVNELAPRLGASIEVVPLPEMATVDTPEPAAVPGFVSALAAGIETALDAGPPPALDLEPFRWSAVARKVHALWREALDAAAPPSRDDLG